MTREYRYVGGVAPTRARFPRIALGCVVLADFALNGCSTDGSSEATVRNAEALSSPKTAEVANAPSPLVAKKPSVAKDAPPIKDRYIAVFKKGAAKTAASARSATTGTPVDEDVAATLGKTYGGAVHRRYRHAIDGMAVQLSPGSVEALRADPRVEYVVPDTKVTTHDVTWGRDRIDQRQLPLNQVYNAPGSGEGVHAYIIDTGILATHSEFQGGPGGVSRIGAGIDLYNDDSDPEDARGHGTHVAGIIGGTRYGVANQVTLHPVKVFGTEEDTSTSILIEAVDWVTARHLANPSEPSVVNMSLGGGLNSALNDAVANSIAAGLAYVVSAGNNGEAPPPYGDACSTSPASTPSAITVGASDLYDSRWNLSNYGRCVDLFAPGSRVLSASYKGDNESIRYDGTSMAAPHVTGAVALYLSANPTATPAQVAAALVGKATRGALSNTGVGSPNRLLFVGNLLTNGGDAQAPFLQITAPAINGVVSGLTTVSVTASDNNGVTGVELAVDGKFEVDDLLAPYALPLDTTRFANGPHELTVRAYDAAGNTTVSTQNVQITQETNPPVIVVTSPANEASVGAVTTIRATATDASGIVQVRFVVDDAEIGYTTTPVSTDTYEQSWDSRSVTVGPHRIVVQALDKTGLWGVASAVNVNVFTDSLPPSVTMTAPAGGTNVSGTVSLTANASDDRGVISEVNFLVNEQVICTDTTAPYQCSWNTRPEGNGPVTLRVKASDRFGNVGSSSPRTVTVQNSPVATYNTTLKVPTCGNAGASCSSGHLTDGQFSTEPNQPNTLGGSCADGPSLGRYHFEESIDRLHVATVDGTTLASGKRVTVEAKAYLLGDADYIDLYYAPDANAPAWTYVSTLHRTGSVHDIVSLTTEFNLAASGGALQAIRANLRAYGTPSTCTTGEGGDRDDLVFAVSSGARPCTGLCTDPTLFSSAGYNSGNIGTAARCYETTANPMQFNCGNFASGRSFSVNNQLVTCNNQNITLAPIAKRNGGYCFQASAGNYAWAYFATF